MPPIRRRRESPIDYIAQLYALAGGNRTAGRFIDAATGGAASTAYNALSNFATTAMPYAPRTVQELLLAQDPAYVKGLLAAAAGSYAAGKEVKAGFPHVKAGVKRFWSQVDPHQLEHEGQAKKRIVSGTGLHRDASSARAINSAFGTMNAIAGDPSQMWTDTTGRDRDWETS